MIIHASISSYFKNIWKDYSYFIFLFQQHLPNKKLSKGVLPCHWILFLAARARPLGHHWAGSISSVSGPLGTACLGRDCIQSNNILSCKILQKLWREWFYQETISSCPETKSWFIFSLPSLCVLKYPAEMPRLMPFLYFSAVLKSFLKCWMEKNLALHDPHCIPGLLLTHLLWNILMVVGLEVEDLFCFFFENCIPVPICTTSCALKRIRKGGCEKGFKSSVLEVLLKCHWSSTSWLALCQCASVLEQAELGKEVVNTHISPKLYETPAHLSILQLDVLIAAVLLRNLLFTWPAERIHSDAGFVSCSGGVAQTTSLAAVRWTSVLPRINRRAQHE